MEKSDSERLKNGTKVILMTKLKKGDFFCWRPKQRARKIYSCDIIKAKFTKTILPEKLTVTYYLPNGNLNMVILSLVDRVFLPRLLKMTKIKKRLINNFRLTETAKRLTGQTEKKAIFSAKDVAWAIFEKNDPSKRADFNK